jgi:hypothetical protein
MTVENAVSTNQAATIPILFPPPRYIPRKSNISVGVSFTNSYSSKSAICNYDIGLRNNRIPDYIKKKKLFLLSQAAMVPFA